MNESNSANPGTDTPPTPQFPEPPPLDTPLPERLDLRVLFESLLRQPAALAHRLGEPNHNATGKLAALALGAAAVFGVVLGTFAMHEQLWAVPLKITAGILIAALICFPSLYIFGSLAGARASAGHLAATFAGALALAGLLLLGFAPAVWIFTQSTNSLGFMGFLALAAWGVSLGFGLGFLARALRAVGATRTGPFFVWSVIFILVTLQMTTSLRPILGRSEQFLTSEKRFFLQHWVETVGESLDSDAAPATTRRGATSDSQRAGESNRIETPTDSGRPTSEKPQTRPASEKSVNPYYAE